MDSSNTVETSDTDTSADEAAHSKMTAVSSDYLSEGAPGEVESSPLPPSVSKIEPGMSLYDLVRTDFIRCVHCTEVYTYPCILPCLHSFCGSCIDKLHELVKQGEC